MVRAAAALARVGPGVDTRPSRALTPLGGLNCEGGNVRGITGGPGAPPLLGHRHSPRSPRQGTTASTQAAPGFPGADPATFESAM